MTPATMYQFSRKNGLRWTSQTDGFGGGRGGTTLGLTSVGLGGSGAFTSGLSGSAGTTSVGFGGSTAVTSRIWISSPVNAWYSSGDRESAHRSTKTLIVTGSRRSTARRLSTARTSGSTSACRQYHR